MDARLQTFVRRLRVLADRPSADGLTDSDLLDRFLSQRDEAAFEVLIRRHADLVWNLCRRMLRNEHDAEDAPAARRRSSGMRMTSCTCWPATRTSANPTPLWLPTWKAG